MTGIGDCSDETCSVHTASLVIMDAWIPQYFSTTSDSDTPFRDPLFEAQPEVYPIAQHFRPDGPRNVHYEGCIHQLELAYEYFDEGGVDYKADVVDFCTQVIDANDSPIVVRLEALQFRAAVTSNKTLSASDRARARRTLNYLPVCCALVDRVESVKANMAKTRRLKTLLTLQRRRLNKDMHTKTRLTALRWQAAQRAYRLDPCASANRRSLKQKARRIRDEIDGQRSLGDEEKFLEAVSLGQDVAEGARLFLLALSKEDRAHTPPGVLSCAMMMLNGSWRQLEDGLVRRMISFSSARHEPSCIYDSAVPSC